MNNDGAKYLSEALKKNKTLKSLDIGNNNIDKEGVKIILDSF